MVLEALLHERTSRCVRGAIFVVRSDIDKISAVLVGLFTRLEANLNFELRQPLQLFEVPFPFRGQVCKAEGHVAHTSLSPLTWIGTITERRSWRYWTP